MDSILFSKPHKGNTSKCVTAYNTRAVFVAVKNGFFLMKHKKCVEAEQHSRWSSYER